MRESGADEPADLWLGRTAASLATSWAVPTVHPYARVGSTSDVARRLAGEGAPAGTTVVALEQVAGRGRAGRVWSSPAGLGLWVSMVARPAPLAEPGALPLRVGLAVARALDRFARDAVCLKWPNDLLLGGRKVAGVLCEAAWSGGDTAFVVVGVGVNVLHREGDFPPLLRGTATSLRMESGGAPTLLDVADELVPRIDAATRSALHLDAHDRAELDRRDSLRGLRVTVTDPVTGAPLGEGIAAGIANDGAFLLREGSREPRPLRSGTVRVSHDDCNDDELRDQRLH